MITSIRTIGLLLLLCIGGLALSARSVEVAAIIDSINVNNATCGLENGIITIFASGGANIRYSVDNGVTYQDSNVFTGLPNDDYLIVIISGTTCSDVNSVTLLQNNSPALPVLTCPDLIEVDCLDDPISFINSQLEIIPATNFNDQPLDVSPTSPLQDLDISLCNQTQAIELFAVDTCMGRSTCMVDIAFTDDNPPQLVCPTAFDVFIGDPDHIALIEGWEMSIDGVDPCGGPIDYNSDIDYNRINFLCDSFFIIPVEFVGMDMCGNLASCSSQLNVTNELDPVVTCLPDFTVDCNADPEEVLDELLVQFEGDPAFDEDVSIADGSNIEDIVGLLCGETITLEFGVVDGCQRTTDCSTQVMIQDTILPSQSPCPGNLIFDSITETTGSEIRDWLDNAPGATDNCSSIDFSTDFDDALLSDLCNWPDTITVQFIAADRCGNSTFCESRVFVPNNLINLVCQDNLIIECGNPSQDQEVEDWLNMAAASDLNGLSIPVLNNFNGLDQITSCTDTLVVSFSANSSCGQPSCESRIIIEDTTAPQLNCPNNETINLSTQNVIETIDQWLISAQSSDLCSTPSVNSDFDTAAFEIGCTLDTVIVFSVTDACGLSNTCSSTLSIINDLAIELDCPEDVTVSCTSTDINAFITNAIEEGTSSSREVVISSNLDSFEISECIEIQNFSIDLLATDVCGDTDACSFEVTIVPDARIYQPTIFSLTSADEANKSFSIFGDASVTISYFEIFDRWGNSVHMLSNNPDQNNIATWDGRINGQMAEQGVYTYLLRYVDLGGESTQLIGQFTLVR